VKALRASMLRACARLPAAARVLAPIKEPCKAHGENDVLAPLPGPAPARDAGQHMLES